MATVLAATIAVSACSSSDGLPTLYIGGIPDQGVSVLEARFDKLADYLSEETGVTIEYIPSVAYAAVVTAFRNGDILLAWYGGLTGVQARIFVPGAQAIAQRDVDQDFRSVFIARPDSGIRSLEDLVGKTFTFGSISSTSGHLMPRVFLTQAGIDPEADLGLVSYSGSHDKTWKLVESGAFEAGALNANIWADRVDAGGVDLEKVDLFFTTPGYVDYHWVAHPDLDETYGDGFIERLREALLKLDASNGGRDAEILSAFQAVRFIPTANENYAGIEEAARAVGIIG